jgi:hypothetical protein
LGFDQHRAFDKRYCLTHLIIKSNSSLAPVILIFSRVCTPARKAMKRNLEDMLAPGNNGPHLTSSSSGINAGDRDKFDINDVRSTAGHIISRSP